MTRLMFIFSEIFCVDDFSFSNLNFLLVLKSMKVVQSASQNIRSVFKHCACPLVKIPMHPLLRVLSILQAQVHLIKKRY